MNYTQLENKLIFGVELSPIHNKFYINIKAPEQFYCGTLPRRASYSVLEARILGISYPDYLRVCASMGATIMGKGSLFPKAMFDNADAARVIAKLLNKRASVIAWEMENKTSTEDIIKTLKEKVYSWGDNKEKPTV